MSERIDHVWSGNAPDQAPRTEGSAIRVLIVDDHSIVREGLKAVLNREPDMAVVGEAGNFVELLSEMERSSFDLVILEMTLPGKSGLDILRELTNRHLNRNVIVYSMHPEERYAMRALKAGARSYIRKDAPLSELVYAIRRAVKGENWANDSLVRELISRMADRSSMMPHDLLSDREYEVLRRLAMGETVKQIACELSLSANTIRTYKSRIWKKMEIRSLTELTRYALDHKLID